MFLIIYNHTTFFSNFSMQFFIEYRKFSIYICHTTFHLYNYQTIFFLNPSSLFFSLYDMKNGHKKDCIHKEYSLSYLQIKPDISVLPQEVNPVCG